MTRPALCIAFLAQHQAWKEYQRAVDHSMRLGEMTDEEILARQNYDAALTDWERASHTHQEALCA